MSTGEHSELREFVLQRLQHGAASELRDTIHGLHPADLAQILESIPPEQRRLIWFEVAESDMGEILAKASDGVRENLIANMDSSTLVRAIQKLDIDDIAELVPDLSSQIIADVMVAVDEDRRQGLGAVLSYEEQTAGRLMNVDTVVVRETISVGVVMRYLRLRGELPEPTDKLYVVDREGMLRGTLLLRNLVTSDLSQQVSTVMDESPHTFSPSDSEEHVANSFERYDLTSAPVIDDKGHLIGRITIDDVVDVIQDSASRTFLAPAGLDDEEDIFAPVFQTARKRAIWLGVNLVTAVLASWVIGQFEEAIEKLVALAVLMPIIASMGGNAGTQTLTKVIRGLGVGTISIANAKDVLKKELLVGGLNGLVWALVVACISILWYQNYGLAAIVAIAMLVNICVSAASGVLLPVLLERVGIDPSLAAGVALTTITDVVGFLAILGFAALVLV
ncbi:MAG: magnesium transporter [Acidiferrobacterales bacterium]|nr:magnesium transporter [Acidiferrobacterales bacterium]